MRILLAPHEVAGFFGRVNIGFKECGENSKFFDLSESYTKYEGADKFPLLETYKAISKWSRRFPRLIRLFLVLPINIAVRAFLFAFSLIWPQVIIFGFASTYLGGWELPIYRLLKKKIVFIYFGSDSRPHYLNAKTILKSNALEAKELRRCERTTRKQAKKIRWLDKFSDIILDHPPTGMLHDRGFIPFLCLGIPIPKVDDVKDLDRSKRIIILHAPSFPEGKGTYFIRQLVDKYRLKYDIEYVELIGKPNSEVLNWLNACTFVIDELYSDSVLAGLGTEAALYGKPTLVAGYAQNYQLGVDESMIPPAFKVFPDDFENAFKEILDDPEKIIEMGHKARDFVLREWSRDIIAKKLLRLIDGSANSVTEIDPKKIDYYLGWGISRDYLKRYLKAYLGKNGKKGLFISDKQDLEASILDFISGADLA